ncbi:MAG: RsmD family RNA methyltransferase [Pyrinomonadaceae bacterium]
MENRHRSPETGSFSSQKSYTSPKDRSSFRYGHNRSGDSIGSGSNSFRYKEKESSSGHNGKNFGNSGMGNTLQRYSQTSFTEGFNSFKSRTPSSRRAASPKLRRFANDVQISSELQITDGKFRGRMLQNSASASTLPTTGLMREVIFRTIFNRIRGSRFLDLCAGSGMVGFEAISRGVMLATFVERSAKMSSLIRKNMEDLGIKQGHGEVIEMEIMPFLKRAAKRCRFWDIVYFDSCDDMYIEEKLNIFATRRLLKSGGLLFVEHGSAKILPVKLEFLRKAQTFVHDEKTLSFYEKQ